jgi:hypothetical protein
MGRMERLSSAAPETGAVDDREFGEHIAQVVMSGLLDGQTVEIDGLGSFFPDRDRFFRFEPRIRPQVFIAYVVEDRQEAERLYDTLESAGFAPWMDTRKLLPGQNWPRAIESAIEASEFFVACFSSNSVGKKGGFQAEIRYALDCARQLPLDQVFVAPVRLDDCPVPRAIQREYQYVDLHPDWTHGVRRLVAMMRKELARRKGEVVPPVRALGGEKRL